MTETVRIAMWSGPRNISTAMMRAFENRGDCAVVDEPFYAHYLAQTGLDHPGRDEVIATGETDWRAVVAALVGPVPDARPVFYQKHMTHHMLTPIGHDWFDAVNHVFLIRDPREVLLSYLKSRPRATAEDIGVLQEAALYDEIAAHTGAAPPVIDADEFLKNPQGHLRALCTLLQIPFSERMLRWQAGPRVSDGVWAPHWYDAVLKSTGFEPWRERDLHVPEQHRRVIDSCMPAYEYLYSRRMLT
jgi:Sulfotransferase domain